MLRVWIERGLMVGMAFLAGYRMMTLDYSTSDSQDSNRAAALSSSSTWAESSHGYQQEQQLIQHDALPGLARSAWALGAGKGAFVRVSRFSTAQQIVVELIYVGTLILFTLYSFSSSRLIFP